MCVIGDSVLQKREEASTAVREFRSLKNLRRYPMSTEVIWTTIKRFEETEKLEVQLGRDRKPVTPILVDVVKTAVAAK